MSGDATGSVPTSGLVLAGGAGRRMGGHDKRTVLVDGRPLLTAAVEAVITVCAEVLVASGEGPLPQALPAVRTVADRLPGAGPLAGLEAGLEAAAHPVVLVLAGDHPAAAPGVLAALRDRLVGDERLEAVVLGTVSGPQPLVGAYRRTCGAEVTRLLHAGERRAHALLDGLLTATLPVEDWRPLDRTLSTAVDLDTPADLQAWRSRR